MHSTSRCLRYSLRLGIVLVILGVGGGAANVLTGYSVSSGAYLFVMFGLAFIAAYFVRRTGQ